MTVLPDSSGRQNSAYRSGCHNFPVFNILLNSSRLSVHNSVHFSAEARVARVNILQRVKIEGGWANVALKRNTTGRIRWPSGGRFLIEWRENGKRLRQSAGDTPSEAIEAQKRKRFQLEATDSGFELTNLSNDNDSGMPLVKATARQLNRMKLPF
jgi:hypothetical protein